MLEQKKNTVWYHEAKTVLQDVKDELRTDNPTAMDVIKYFLSDEIRQPYHLYRYNKSQRTFWQRVNLCWFFPLYIISIPVQYLIKGKFGLQRGTVFGRLVDKYVGLS